MTQDQTWFSGWSLCQVLWRYWRWNHLWFHARLKCCHLVERLVPWAASQPQWSCLTYTTPSGAKKLGLQILWILYSRVRVWVAHLSFVKGHLQLPCWRLVFGGRPHQQGDQRWTTFLQKLTYVKKNNNKATYDIMIRGGLRQNSWKTQTLTRLFKSCKNSLASFYLSFLNFTQIRSIDLFLVLIYLWKYPSFFRHSFVTQ